MREINRVTVYCASSPNISDIYFNETKKLAKVLAGAKVEIVYGAGKHGLMGALADAALEAGGQVTGIIPEFMIPIELAHQGLQNLIVTKDMADRKQKLLENIDGLIALPGATGTYDELFDALTLKRLGKITVPIVILNINQYFDPLNDLLNRAISENFMREEHRDMFRIVKTVEEVIPALRDSPSWDESKISISIPKPN